MMRVRYRLSLLRLAMLVAQALLLAMLVPSTGAFAASQAQVPGTSSDCQLLASPPTDYFGIIIPLGEVRCSSTQARIHIEVTLRRDGSAVSFAARDCHKAARCILSVNASNEDIPGNQLWCTDATGKLRNQDLGRAVACETQDF